jgi:hypothetical protein
MDLPSSVTVINDDVDADREVLDPLFGDGLFFIIATTFLEGTDFYSGERKMCNSKSSLATEFCSMYRHRFILGTQKCPMRK